MKLCRGTEFETDVTKRWGVTTTRAAMIASLFAIITQPCAAQDGATARVKILPPPPPVSTDSNSAPISLAPELIDADSFSPSQDSLVPVEVLPTPDVSSAEQTSLPQKTPTTNQGLSLPEDLPFESISFDDVDTMGASNASESITANEVDSELSPTFVPSFESQRPALIFQPATVSRDLHGGAILRPSVHVAESSTEILPSAQSLDQLETLSTKDLDDGRIKSSHVIEKESRGWSFSPRKRWQAFRSRKRRPLAKAVHVLGDVLDRPNGYDLGVGAERLPFALFEMDASQPTNINRLRFEAGYDWQNPDRAEFFWSKLGGKGPAETIPVESSVDYQDIRFLFEVGGEKFSLATELPLRFVDPTVLGNTGGFGDMVLTTKTVLFSGSRWQLTQVLRNQLATGSAKSGRGAGHASMEPGLIARYKQSDEMYVHSELKFWYPLGGDPAHSGPILRYGLGFAKVMYDSDTFALIPTMEFVGWSVLSGQQTETDELLSIATVTDLDGASIFNLYPGLRMVRDVGGDLGMFDVGISAGFTVTSTHWYESMIRMDINFGY